MQNEFITARGEVHVKVLDRSGNVLTEFEEKNLVVTLGKTNLAKLLGGDAGGAAISKIGVGTNGAAAAVTDAALTGSFTKALVSVTYPDAQSVQFHFDIDNSEANGLTIREFGLLTAGGVLCARKVRAAEIAKTDAIRLVGTWKISIN